MNHLTVVSDADNPLPDYPEELLAADVTGHHFMMFRHDLLLQSRLRLSRDFEVLGVQMVMFCEAQRQVPFGSLPVDEMDLVRLIGITISRWRTLAKRDISPLHKWRRYDTPDGPVLGHSVVIDIALRTIGAATDRKARSSAQQAQKSRKRLPELLLPFGLRPDLADNDEFLDFAQAWFAENFRGAKRQGAHWEACVERFFRENKVARVEV